MIIVFICASEKRHFNNIKIIGKEHYYIMYKSLTFSRDDKEVEFIVFCSMKMNAIIRIFPTQIY